MQVPDVTLMATGSLKHIRKSSKICAICMLGGRMVLVLMPAAGVASGTVIRITLPASGLLSV